MKPVLALIAASAVFATGIVAGLAVSTEGSIGGEDDSGDGSAAALARVVVKSKDGESRELSLAEAAARIERLEAQVARTARPRAAVPDEDDEESARPLPSPDLPDVPIPKKPGGAPYSFVELRDLARNSADPVLRLAALRALRRDDSPEARTTLGELLADVKTPLDLRIEAAKALAKPPHRDAAPEELVALLSSPDLPGDVRREIADGVVRLRDRGAWMPQIASRLGKETDAEVRKLLFEAVQRSAGDPAAKAELLSVAANAGASRDERRLAVQALVRLGNDPKVFEALAPLLTSDDAGLRGDAVLALARGGRLSLDRITAALADENAAVRAAAFAARVPGGKDIPKEQRDAAITMAARIATADADADVRRSALAWVSSMPKETAAQVLESARNDPDPLVQIEGYSRSPQSFAKAQPERLVSQLDSPDPRARDAAYRLVVKVWGVDVPYRASWNPKARAAAVLAIRAQVATR